MSIEASRPAKSVQKIKTQRETFVTTKQKFINGVQTVQNGSHRKC